MSNATKTSEKRYDRLGQRVTDCCGVYSTYSGDVLVCKKCWGAVSIGEGDGNEFAEGVSEKEYFRRAARADEAREGTLLPDLPETIRYDYAPYTFGAVLGDLRWERYKGYAVLAGTVREGTERSFLFGASASRSIVGKAVRLYGVRPSEIERGFVRQAAS